MWRCQLLIKYLSNYIIIYIGISSARLGSPKNKKSSLKQFFKMIVINNIIQNGDAI